MRLQLDPIFTIVRIALPNGPAEFRVRRVDPQFAAQAAMLVSSLGVIVSQPETEAERLGREQRAAADMAVALSTQLACLSMEVAQRELDPESLEVQALAKRGQTAAQAAGRARRRLEPRVALTPKAMRDIVTRQQELVCVSVKAARSVGEEWEPITFVMDEAQDDPECNQVWVGRLDEHTLNLLIKAAWAPAREAAERLASFRVAEESRRAAGAAPDGEPLRSAAQ